MKKIFLILFVAIMAVFVAPVHSLAQNPLLSEREMLVKLYEKMEEISKQQVEMSKQQAVTNAKIEAMDKRIDNLEKSIDNRFENTGKRFDDANKRMDMLFYVMLAILAGIFGLIGFVVYDRQASVKPILDENKQLFKDIEQLTQRELRHEENVANYFKKIAQIDNRFAGIV